MTTGTPINQALVSLWSKPDSTAQADFVCSGVFVGPTAILTAAHAVKGAAPLWITAFGVPNSHAVRHRDCHPELDVAVLMIESVPPFASFLQCNRSMQLPSLPRPLTLNGFFEGRLEAAQELSVLNFSDEDRNYVTQLKQPRGQSGSPVCTADGQVWALAVRHYADANTLRGGVIAVHQFAEWLDVHVPSPTEGKGEVEPKPPVEIARPTPTTQAALTQLGLDDAQAPFIVSACVVSDAADRLMDDISALKERALSDPLLPAATRQRARKADLAGMLGEAALRPRLLERLSVTGFSAYVYFAVRSQLSGVAADELHRRFLVEPLVQRLRKRSEHLTAVRSDQSAIQDIVSRAADVVRGEGLKVATPESLAATSPGSRAMLELSRLVAAATARHLEAPADEDATTLFEHLRTRIRLAMNVATREVHTRDRNPLP